MAGWLSGWGYRKPNTLTGINGEQFKITVHSGSGVDTSTDVFCNNHTNSNFSDLRFTLSDGITLLNYVIDSFISGVSTVVYIQIIFSGTQTIYLYYGNSAASYTGTLVKNTQQLNSIINLNDAVPIQSAGGCNVFLNQSFSGTIPSDLYEARVAQKGLTTYSQITNDANGIQTDDIYVLYIDGTFEFGWSDVGNACGITGTTLNSSYINKSFNITTTLSKKLGKNVTFNVKLYNYQPPQQWSTNGAVYLFAAFDFGTWGSEETPANIFISDIKIGNADCPCPSAPIIPCSGNLTCSPNIICTSVGCLIDTQTITIMFANNGNIDGNLTALSLAIGTGPSISYTGTPIIISANTNNTIITFTGIALLRGSNMVNITYAWI